MVNQGEFKHESAVYYKGHNVNIIGYRSILLCVLR